MTQTYTPTLVQSRPAARPAALVSGIWVVSFLIAEIACQLILLIPQVAPARAVFRSFAFGLSLLLVVLLPPPPPGTRKHPVVPIAFCIVLLVMATAMHPQTNTFLSGAATIAMYAAILAPLLWIPRVQMNELWLRRIILVMWVFAFSSALVGVAQVLKPSWTFLQPNLSVVIQNFIDGGEGLKILLASGNQVYRPMGLSDQPGAAAVSGMVCILFGMAMLAYYQRRPYIWIACAASMTAGLFCIYLSQVRSVLVMTGVCVIAFTLAIARRGEFGRLTNVLVTLGGVVVLATVWAFTIGGETVTKRLSSLIEDDPRQVYYQNRGHFLEYTFRYVLPEYPFGAGLGRWGMVNLYFGTPDKLNSEVLWAEIQWTAWAYDGGFLLIIAYLSAVLLAIWQSWKIGTRRRDNLGLWGGLIFAYNIGVLAVTFNYPAFMGQLGLDFWVLNAALFAAAQARPQDARPSPPGA